MKLIPIKKEEFKDILGVFIDDYALSLQKSEEVLDSERAQDHAYLDLLSFFPGGFNTIGQYIANIVDEQNNIVGYVWYADAARHNPNTAWLCYIYILDAYRGQGYAKNCIKTVEEKLLQHNRKKLGLNVFAWNQSAFRLYKRLGYECLETRYHPVTKKPTRHYLSKPLTADL